MKWMRWSQGFLAVTAILGAGAGLVSCGTSNTIDYLYAVSAQNNPGQINAYRVDSESGALTQIPTQPFPAGRNPMSLVIDPIPGTNGTNNLYLVNHDDNTVAQYGIGTDGKLYHQQNDVNPSGTEPLSITEHTYQLNGSDGKPTSPATYAHYLYVVETYQPNFTDLAPGPGALYVYLLDPGSGQIGSPSEGVPVTQTVNGQPSAFLPLGNAPTSVTATQDGNRVYVADILGNNPNQTGTPNCGPGQGAIQGYNMQFDGSGNPTGVLQTASGSPYCAGVVPSALASHPYQPTPFLYATDASQNQIITYSINTTTAPGALTPLTSSPTATGTTPDGITVDPRGLYVYVSNKFGQSVSGYAVNSASGALSALASGGSGVTGPQPGCVVVEPALAHFVYTANFLDGTVSGFVLNTDNGALSATQGQFYQASGLTACAAAIQHGNHPVIGTSNLAYPNGNGGSQ